MAKLNQEFSQCLSIKLIQAGDFSQGISFSCHTGSIVLFSKYINFIVQELLSGGQKTSVMPCSIQSTLLYNCYNPMMDAVQAQRGSPMSEVVQVIQCQRYNSGSFT